MVHLVVTFSDGSKWRIPAHSIVEHRTDYYASRGSRVVFEEEVRLALGAVYTLEDWARCFMSWEDVKDVAKPLAVDYAKEWVSAEMMVVEQAACLICERQQLEATYKYHEELQALREDYAREMAAIAEAHARGEHD